MFIIYVTDLSTKNKLLRGGFPFLQKPKIQAVGKRKKIIFFSNSTAENPNFSYMRFFQKMLYVSWDHSFKNKRNHIKAQQFSTH